MNLVYTSEMIQKLDCSMQLEAACMWYTCHKNGFTRKEDEAMIRALMDARRRIGIAEYLFNEWLDLTPKKQYEKGPFSIVSAGVGFRRPTEHNGDLAIINKDKVCLGTIWNKGSDQATEEQAKRISDCLNAMEGIDNPEQFVLNYKVLRDRVKDFMHVCHNMSNDQIDALPAFWEAIRKDLIYDLART